MSAIFLLVLSNVFMTFAWYGHLKYGTEFARLTPRALPRHYLECIGRN